MLFADLTLARRLEAMEAAACVDTSRSVARLHPEIATATEAIAGGWAVFTGAGSPISEARGLGMRGPVTADDMERLETFYHSRGDAVRIEVCPLADASLHQQLAQRGYRLLEFSNMLARPLEGDAATPPVRQGVSTRPAASDEGSVWANLVAHCFAEHVPVTQELLDVMSCWTQSSIGTCFFGLLDGELAGGATVAMQEGVALLGGAGTDLRLRNRGVQQALIEARLAHAARAGCDVAMTVTLPGSGSQRNCERHGFQVVYSRTKFLKE
jgi:hypothetical protein